MDRGVHNHDRGEYPDLIRAAPRSPSRVVLPLGATQDADTFNPFAEPDVVYIPRDSEQLQLYFEPDLEPVRWRPSMPSMPSLPSMPSMPSIVGGGRRTVAAGLIVTSVVAFSALTGNGPLGQWSPFGDNGGGGETVAGPADGDSDAAAEALPFADGQRASTSVAGADVTIGNIRSTSDDPPVLQSSTSASAAQTTSNNRPRQTWATRPAPATMDPQASTTSPTTAQPTTTSSTATTPSSDGSTTVSSTGSSSSNPSSSSLSTTSSSTTASVTAAAVPHLVEFGNQLAPGTIECAEGTLAYTVFWIALDADSVELTLPDGGTAVGTPSGGVNLCGPSGHVLTITAFGAGGNASATTRLR